MPEQAGDSVVEFVIRGVTLEGRPLRPGDWAGPLCGVVAAFGGERRMQCSPYAHRANSAGVRCVLVDVRPQALEAVAYRFLPSFAKGNQLQRRDGRGAGRTELARLQRAGDTD